MKRRDFLKSSGVLSLVLAGLPVGLKAQTSTREPEDYYSYSAGGLDYIMKINNSAVIDFKNAKQEDKRLIIKLEQVNKEDSLKVDALVKYEFWITDVEKSSSGAYRIKTTKGKKLEGTLAWPEKWPDNPDIYLHVRNYAELVEKNGKPGRLWNYENSGDPDEDCFITTACVQERGLADDCNELNTLRFLREDFMRHTPQGKRLLEEYLSLGPAVVQAIGALENRSKIYDYLYQHMILPSVALIKAGKYQEAVDWYEGFSVELKKQYC